MKLLLTVLFAELVCFTHGVNQNDGFTDDEFKQCFNTVPKEAIKVRWNDGLTLDESNRGQICQPSTTATQPKVDYLRRYDKLHTVLFFCVDDEGCAKKVPLLWYIINIASGEVKDGEVQNRYTPPPTSLTKSSRCVIAVAQQSRKLQGLASGLTTAPGIGDLSNNLQLVDINDLVEKNGLTVIVATTFRTQKALPS